MKTVEIKHYAVFREKRGVSSETISTEASDLSELYAELASEFGFSLPTHLVRASVNNAFVDMAESFKSGDEIVFIPPVAGG